MQSGKPKALSFLQLYTCYISFVAITYHVTTVVRSYNVRPKLIGSCNFSLLDDSLTSSFVKACCFNHTNWGNYKRGQG